jgi:hypothetical protein
MQGLIDTKKALKDFVGLGLAFEKERSEDAIADLFNTLCDADRERMMGINTEDLITLSIYYEMTGKLLSSRVDQVIEQETGGVREYLESVRELLRAFGNDLSSVAWETKKEADDEQGG